MWPNAWEQSTMKSLRIMINTFPWHEIKIFIIYLWHDLFDFNWHWYSNKLWIFFKTKILNGKCISITCPIIKHGHNWMKQFSFLNFVPILCNQTQSIRDCRITKYNQKLNLHRLIPPVWGKAIINRMFSFYFHIIFWQLISFNMM